jgi:hypothetical protein
LPPPKAIITAIPLIKFPLTMLVVNSGFVRLISRLSAEIVS